MLIDMKEKTADLNKGENAQDVEKCNIKISQVAQLWDNVCRRCKKGTLGVHVPVKGKDGGQRQNTQKSTQ